MEELKIYCVNNGKSYNFTGGETLLEIYARIKEEINIIPICALVNNKTEGLQFPLYNPKTVEFIPANSAIGKRVYTHSLCFLLYKAIHELHPSYRLKIEHSISKGYYCRLSENNEPVAVTTELLEEISLQMKNDVKADLPFVRHEEPTPSVKEIYRKEGLFAKVKLLDTRHDLYTVFYKLGNVSDSYYGNLAPSTSHITNFELSKYKEGFLLLGPDPSNPSVANTPVVQEKLYEAFTDHLKFNKIIGVTNVGELNEVVLAGKSSDLINVAEALHAKKISSIADDIKKAYDQGGARMVMIAGPSSSGKTTTSKRLAIYLLTNLLRPVTISLDNYFVEREMTPLDEKGEKDYEHLMALDLDLFNDQLDKLLKGKEVELPYYNFELGKRIFRGEKVKLGPSDVLVIEGIHGLNPQLTHGIDEKLKYRVYVSALTTLSIDDHNWVPTTDNRLLRRIIRDFKYRGISAVETIKRWPSVRRGEEKWIFPYQENANAMFNSSLLFELGVMKEYGEEILKRVNCDCEEYAEAYRLRKFLSYFEPIRDNMIPPTSLLREFLGGSSLEY